MPESAAELGERIRLAMRFVPDEYITRSCEAHFRWELREILSHIDWSDLLAGEVLALLAVLCPVHNRVLTGEGSGPDLSGDSGGPVLTVIRDNP